MYAIHIFNELKSKNYKSLIDYAVLESDAVMLLTKRFTKEIELAYSSPVRSEFGSEEQYLGMVDYIEGAKKERYKDEVIFKNSTELFLEKLKPYLIKNKNFASEWPGTVIESGFSEYMNRDICFYRVCNEVKRYLLEPNGLFNWKYPYFPEDISFFKDGYCWFFTVSHEGYGYIYTKNIEVVKKLKKLSAHFEVHDCNDDEVNLFYEDYKL